MLQTKDQERGIERMKGGGKWRVRWKKKKKKKEGYSLLADTFETTISSSFSN
jgi:hypothetical protein